LAIGLVPVGIRIIRLNTTRGEIIGSPATQGR
jgi:hypothetical protein